jgi:hypothetical protein
MNKMNHERRDFQHLLAHCFDNMVKIASRGRGLVLLVTIVILAICAVTNAQTLIGSPGAGWQTWSVLPITGTYAQPDLNENGAPWWDSQWGASGSYEGNPAEKNIGFCMSSTGDCEGMGSGAIAPGTIPFWAMPYDPVGDTGGARDNKVYFHSTGGPLVAVLYLNATSNPDEENEIGWVETNSTGTVVGKHHPLFAGTGVNHDQIPDAVGKVVVFTPTPYFAYYFSDVSEPACPDGSDPYGPSYSTQCGNPALPLHGCYANSLFLLNDAKCTEAGGEQGDHDFVIFSKNPSASLPTYWITGEDPGDCLNLDGDCNLTTITVTKL